MADCHPILSISLITACYAALAIALSFVQKKHVEIGRERERPGMGEERDRDDTVPACRDQKA